MKIGFVIGQLTAGGAEGQLLQVARALRGTAYTPIVYCMSDQTQPIGRALQAAGICLRVIAGDHGSRPRRLGYALLADDIRIVHSWLFIGNTYAWLATLGRDLPLITSARNCKRQSALHTLGNIAAFRASQRIVVNSQEVARYIRRTYLAPANRLALIYNGVDTERFRPGEGAAGDPLVIGIGRLVPQKDPLLFVEAAARLVAAHPSVRFAFVGAGPLREQVARAVAARGLQARFELPGESDDVAAALRRATLFWLTSAWEGLPNVVLEAMASGVPAVATDVGGTRELVRSGVDGFLVQHGDIEALVDYSAGLLGDAERRRSFAQRARERAEGFSTARMIDAMIRLYGEVGPRHEERTAPASAPQLGDA